MTKMYDFSEPDMCQPLRDRGMELLGHLTGTPARLLEIGVWDGRSACWLLDNILTHPDARYVGVDIVTGHEDAHQRALKNLWNHSSKVSLARGDSRDVLKFAGLGELFDVVFVDGCHSYEGCLADLHNGFDLLKPGGILLADDFGHPEYEVRAAAHQFMSEENNFDMIHCDWMIAWRKV